MAQYQFAVGFIIGSVFNLFVIWFNNMINKPKHKEIKKENKKFLKDVEKIVSEKDKQLKDLSLTIKNLHINPQEKEDTKDKDIVIQDEKKEIMPKIFL